MAELVMVEGLGGFVNSHENIELLDMQAALLPCGGPYH